jgi:hypothetical protein
VFHVRISPPVIMEKKIFEKIKIICFICLDRLQKMLMYYLFFIISQGKLMAVFKELIPAVDIVSPDKLFCLFSDAWNMDKCIL